MANSSRFRDEKQTRLNNKILEAVWGRLKGHKDKLVSQSILEWQLFKFDSQSLLHKNSQSGNPILWFYNYGLELVDPAKKIFEIHKKS